VDAWPPSRLAALLLYLTIILSLNGPEFQKWLKRENRAGSDVFVGMNPLKEGATSRSKENIREIRHVYLDLDENAPASLARVRESSDVPPPNFVLDTSPETSGDLED
jgi:hypothetical protein